MKNKEIILDYLGNYHEAIANLSNVRTAINKLDKALDRIEELERENTQLKLRLETINKPFKK